MVMFCGKVITPNELHYRLVTEDYWETRTWTTLITECAKITSYQTTEMCISCARKQGIVW